MNDRVVAGGRVEEDAQYEVGLRPRALDDYIGQDSIRNNLRVSIDAARRRGEALDHVLLYGPPGLGKTTLAYVIGNEMGVSVRATAGPVIEKPGDLAAMLSNLQQHEVLFIDEIHRMAPAIEEILYPAMEDYELDIVIGQGPSARSVKVPLQRCVLVEDSLMNQKAAHRVGMRAVWMQRWARGHGHGPEQGARLRRRPVQYKARDANHDRPDGDLCADAGLRIPQNTHARWKYHGKQTPLICSVLTRT